MTNAGKLCIGKPALANRKQAMDISCGHQPSATKTRQRGEWILMVQFPYKLPEKASVSSLTSYFFFLASVL